MINEKKLCPFLGTFVIPRPDTFGGGLMIDVHFTNCPEDKCYFWEDGCLIKNFLLKFKEEVKDDRQGEG
jgi:hypothetical protein